VNKSFYIRMGRARKKTVIAITPDKMPQPWLCDSEFLLNELARIRELILHIPPKNDSLLPINTAIDSIWRLEQQLRYLLSLTRDMQKSFAQKAQLQSQGEPEAPDEQVVVKVHRIKA